MFYLHTYYILEILIACNIGAHDKNFLAKLILAVIEKIIAPVSLGAYIELYNFRKNYYLI
jgi:hypothetical protein